MPEILYEDNHLLIANKPKGLLTQPSGTSQPNLEDSLKAWLKEKYQKPGNVFLEAVHRLDKPVSGVVIFAKTSKALSRLNASMRAKQSQKRYFALVEGIPSPTEADLEDFLVHDDFKARVVPENTPGAKHAKLHYRVVKEVNGNALIDITLLTGRYHQIRVQFAHRGHPIIGDEKYGSKHSREGIALHHYLIQFPHPITQEILTIEAPEKGGPPL